MRTASRGRTIRCRWRIGRGEFSASPSSRCVRNSSSGGRSTRSSTELRTWQDSVKDFNTEVTESTESAAALEVRRLKRNNRRKNTTPSNSDVPRGLCDLRVESLFRQREQGRQYFEAGSNVNTQLVAHRSDT